MPKEDVISVHKQVQSAKANGKSKDFISHRLKHEGCPHGRKNCGVCTRGTLGKTLDKGKGKNKNKNEKRNVRAGDHDDS